jgi:hypothetical protein
MLGVKQSDFTDPDEVTQYLVGVTSVGGDRKQFITKIEEDGETKVKTSGNYTARTQKEVAATADGTDAYKITDNFGYLKAGDTLD